MFTMFRGWRFTRFLLLLVAILSLYIPFLVWRQYSFEKGLQDLSINFDDLQPDYAEFLQHAEHPTGNDHYDDSLLLQPDADNHILPIIHFIWFQDLYNEHLDVSMIPSTGSHAPDDCRAVNPNFTVNVWNETAARDLLETHYSWVLPTYDGYQYPIQRVDAFKYFLLWHYGGIYMDLDITCRRSLLPLLRYPAWFPKAQPFGVNNDLMAVRRHHPLMEKMTKMLPGRDWNLIFPYLTIYWSTGPQFTSDAVRGWWMDDKSTYVRGETKSEADPDNFFVLSLPFYSEEYTFFGHSPGGTWHGGDVAFVLWFVDRPWVFFILLFCLIIGVILWVVRRRQKARSQYAPVAQNEASMQEAGSRTQLPYRSWTRWWVRSDI